LGYVSRGNISFDGSHKSLIISGPTKQLNMEDFFNNYALKVFEKIYEKINKFSDKGKGRIKAKSKQSHRKPKKTTLKTPKGNLKYKYIHI
jgi:hypothetical protein